MNRLAEWKRPLLYALVQARGALAALDLRDYRAFRSILTGSARGFSDPTRLTAWTKGVLYAHIAIVAVRLCLLALDPSGAAEAPDLSSAPGATWWILTMVVLFGNVVMLPAWTHRANHNARQLGASDMSFTPEWAAGWYFLPPGLLWKPYLVMKEIWQATVDPTDWRRQCGSALVGWWWTLWLITAWGGLLGFAVSALLLETGDAQTLESVIGLARGLLHVPLTLLLLTIITKIHDMQMTHHRNRSEDAKG